MSKVVDTGESKACFERVRKYVIYHFLVLEHDEVYYTGFLLINLDTASKVFHCVLGSY